MILRFDGASKGNPGLSGSAAVLLKDNKIIGISYHYHKKPATNNVAEYYGLIIGLKMAIANGHKNIFVEGDSKLVIEQVFGKWKCAHPNMIPLCNEVKELKKHFTSIHGKWIPREENGEADKYANIAVDKKESMGNVEWFAIAKSEDVKKTIKTIKTTKTTKTQKNIMEALSKK
jgi:ribonuclease HI